MNKATHAKILKNKLRVTASIQWTSNHFLLRLITSSTMILQAFCHFMPTSGGHNSGEEPKPEQKIKGFFTKTTLYQNNPSVST